MPGQPCGCRREHHATILCVRHWLAYLAAR